MKNKVMDIADIEIEGSKLDIAIGVSVHRKLDAKLSEIFGNSTLDEHGKIMACLYTALDKMSLVMYVLHDEDLENLNGYPLSGVTAVVEDVWSVLSAGVDLDTQTR